MSKFFIRISCGMFELCRVDQSNPYPIVVYSSSSLEDTLRNANSCTGMNSLFLSLEVMP